MSLLLKLPRNADGRDFVVGDLHGEFDRLEELLVEVGFNYKVDRLISVGDLVDRGPDSDQCLEWLARPNFFAVMGNHELMALAHACGDAMHAVEHVTNGGAWMADMTQDVKMEYANAFARLPLAIELDTAAGPVGIVHADVPAGMSWQHLTRELDGGLRDHANWLLWSRERIKAEAEGETILNVDGIRRVYVGHTPVKEPRAIGNVMHIDTGACFGGPMVLVDALTGEVAAKR